VAGGTVVQADGSFRGDVLVRDGRIESVLARDGSGDVDEGAPGPGLTEARRIDATGLLVLPGLTLIGASVLAAARAEIPNRPAAAFVAVGAARTASPATMANAMRRAGIES